MYDLAFKYFGVSNLAKMLGVSKTFLYYLKKGKRKSKEKQKILKLLDNYVRKNYGDGFKEYRRTSKEERVSRWLELGEAISSLEVFDSLGECLTRFYENAAQDWKDYINEYLLVYRDKASKEHFLGYLYTELQGTTKLLIEDLDCVKESDFKRQKMSLIEFVEFLEGFTMELRIWIELESSTGLVKFEIAS